MVPSELRVHCWLAPPLQSQIATLVPAAVAWPGTSRHLLPYTCRAPLDRRVHCWLVPPLQSQISTPVPLAVPRPVTSRQRPEPLPRSANEPLPVPPPGLLVWPQPYCSRSSPDWLFSVSVRLVPLPFTVVMAQDALSHGPGPCVWLVSLTPVHSTVPIPWLRAVSVTA